MQGQGKTAKKGKPALRIIPGGAATPSPSPVPAADGGSAPPSKPRAPSNLGRLFAAYADAIDRDVKLLLDL